MDSSEESSSTISDFSDVLTMEIRQDPAEDLAACETCGECFSVSVDPAKHFCSADPRCLSSRPALRYAPGQRSVCGTCSEVFPDQRSLSEHRCQLQQFACPICSKVFASHGNLKKHIPVHTGTQRFECPVCTKSLTNRGNLTKHMMIHSGVRPYKCEACGRAFTLRRNLKEHLLIHQGIRPYACTTCGKTFTQLSNLNQHLLIHAGIQNYPCELCGKCFTLRGNLKKHILIHAQEYAFSCEFCGKAFTLGGNLKKHLASRGTKCYKMNGRPEQDDFPPNVRESGNESALLFDSVYSEVTVETEHAIRRSESESSSENVSSCKENDSDPLKLDETQSKAPPGRNEALKLEIKQESADGGPT